MANIVLDSEIEGGNRQVPIPIEFKSLMEETDT